MMKTATGSLTARSIKSIGKLTFSLLVRWNFRFNRSCRRNPTAVGPHRLLTRTVMIGKTSGTNYWMTKQRCCSKPRRTRKVTKTRTENNARPIYYLWTICYEETKVIYIVFANKQLKPYLYIHTYAYMYPINWSSNLKRVSCLVR